MVLSEDQAKFVIGLIVSVPLSYYLRKLKTKNNRYLYSIILGTLLQFFVYGIDIWMPFVIHLIVYGIIKIKGRKCGALITGTTIIALSLYHIYRLIVDYGSWILDISTILMSMVCKYSLFAYAYEDGGKNKQELSSTQQQNKLVQLPSLYEYLSYCQFLPTCIIGTAVQYKTFSDYMQMKQPYNDVPKDQIIKNILYEFGYSLICGSVYIINVIFFPLSTMQNYAFANEQPLYIIYFSFFCVAFLRFKYYFGWKLSQCAVHASGISYISDNNFTRVRTCDPWKVQSTVHLREKVANWNMSSELWLRRCIYQRAPFKNKYISQAYVFVISSFWHGFYGGYYLSFFFWYLQINLSLKVFKFVQLAQKHPIVKIYQKSGIIGEIFLWLFVNIVFTINGLYFQILDSSLGLLILKRIFFIPPILIILATIFFSKITKKSKKVKDQKEHTKKQTVKQD